MVVGVLQRGLLAVQDVPVAERGQDRSHGRFADVAAAPATVLRDQVGEGPDTAYPDDVEQLLAGVVEVLAQRPGLGDAGLGEQLLEQRYAGAAGGAGSGAGFHGGDVGAPVFPYRREDGVLGDSVAGADLGGAGQDGAIPLSRREEREWRRRQRAAEAGAQRRVRGRVADQDTAEQHRRVVGEHQLRVDPGGWIGERHVERPGGLAEGGDVDAEQLELRGGVRTRERGRAAK